MATPSLQSPKKPQSKSESKSNMGRCVIVKEDVDLSDISKSDLTADCYFIHRTDGKVDVAKGSAVHIFDDYYDRGITLTQIEMSGGSLNPKLNSPKI
jgi:hypothetical protein